MARLTRVHQKVFASNASNNGVFGSLQAGNPTTSNDVATLQSLSAFENGWDDAAYSGDKLPPLEEFQGIQYGISYQQAYMLQEGIAEWNASTPYYKGSLTKTISGTSFKLYCSLADNNTGNVVTNTTYWKLVMDSDDLYATQNQLSTAISTLLSNLYPVGSIYIGTQVSCPIESLITGSTWDLVGSGIQLPLDSQYPVVGNGNALGLYTGSTTTSPLAIGAATGNMGISTSIPSTALSESAALSTGYTSKQIGVTTDGTKSGLVSDLSSATSLTCNIWQRTS